jgi:hypothetical protein
MSSNQAGGVLKLSSKLNEIKQKQKTKRAEILQKLRNFDDANNVDELTKPDCRSENSKPIPLNDDKTESSAHRPNEINEKKRKLATQTTHFFPKKDKKPSFRIPAKIKYDDKYLYQNSKVFHFFLFSWACFWYMGKCNFNRSIEPQEC